MDIQNSSLVFEYVSFEVLACFHLLHFRELGEVTGEMWENAETKVNKERRRLWSSHITNAVTPALHKSEPQTESRNTLRRPLAPKVSRVSLTLVLQSTQQSRGFTAAYPTDLAQASCRNQFWHLGKNTSLHSSSCCLHWDLLGCCFPCCQPCCFNLLFFIFNHKWHFWEQR